MNSSVQFNSAVIVTEIALNQKKLYCTVQFCESSTLFVVNLLMNKYCRATAVRLLAWALGSLFLLAGCAPLPPEQDHHYRSPQMAFKFPQKSGALVIDKNHAPWWQVFADSRLATLEKKLLENSPQLQLAALEVQAQQARLGQVVSAQGPQVDMDGSYNREAVSENSHLARLGASTHPSNEWNVGVEASWELDLWGYLDSLEQAARERLLASHADLGAVRISDAAGLARHYLLWRGVDAQCRLVQQQIDLAKREVKLVDSRVHNGVATTGDLSSARARLAALTAQLPPLKQQQSHLQHLLEQMLGQEPGTLDELLAGENDAMTLPAQIPVQLTSTQVHQRPDIQRAESNLRETLANIDAARADFYPRVGLTGHYGRDSFLFSNLGHWGSREFNIGPTFHLPIFEGGRLKRTLELAEVKQQQAAIRYFTTVLDAWHEVDDALQRYSQDNVRYSGLTDAVNEQQNVLAQAKSAKAEGYASDLDVISAQQQLLERQRVQLRGTTDTALSIVALYRSLGGDWPMADEVAGAQP